MTLLRLNNITRRFPLGSPLYGPRKYLVAVDGVSLDVEMGRTTGIVGESGCGKSTTGRIALGLEPPDSGGVLFQGLPLPRIDSNRWRAQRRQMQLVFQDTLAALDRRMTVSALIAEPLAIHGIGDSASRKQRVAELLHGVGLGEDHGVLYPHQLSGGQRQRVVLARALAPKPSLLVCDEPVSALDLSVQAQIVNLLMDLQQELGLGLLFISHDLRVVRHVSDRIVVMYLGRVVEQGRADAIIDQPAHPYTQALVSAMPRLPGGFDHYVALPGEPPSPTDRPCGCPFHPRCPLARDVCRQSLPELLPLGTERQVACHLVRH
ncbi:ABC transporter ATP-binding protein [Mesorhizobium loti]|uniref:Oligopeptide ABC transporter n=1 Tax=Rhizobium loti TaxID=381 RepID=M5B2J0_RHILI|nr:MULTISPECIES: ABC transporter ATP-binding protein [Mesorhizobium]ANN60952.1 peptide ABC transporter ATP-binding protein [Mesorhizobium loti NZP2037]OBP85580.1 peptide ABC transporter ATP-binding protein [Mesorhizobium loti]OBP96930.1 peptide ABC transporter ATP-binding protein [Mesorhizobium loti]OBQ73508.1 peptide ABC transporter ATP-binding protein [Mesorhizobium loti]QKC66521.1 ABC transporter ATP-binding protein [Mesorhizobium jarvisii]